MADASGRGALTTTSLLHGMTRAEPDSSSTSSEAKAGGISIAAEAPSISTNNNASLFREHDALNGIVHNRREIGIVMLAGSEASA